MKKILLLISAVLLAACTNSNNNNPTTTNAANNNVAASVVKTVETPKEVDWDKPQYSLDDHGDTITRWIYDERGRLAQIFTNYDDEGVPNCITVYTYTGNKAHVVFTCEPGYQEDITYADESCTKIIENSGQIYEYDEEGRLSRIIIGNSEITYDYSIIEDGAITHADISGNLFQQKEERDKLGRLTYESYVDGLDIYSTTYTYEDHVCHVRVENTIYEKDGVGGISDLDNTYIEEYEYDIYY